MRSVKELCREIPPSLRMRPWSRHSMVLLVAGLVYIGVGCSLITNDLSPARARSLAIALQFFPADFWGWVWVICGIMAVISSRWPAVAESWGYVVLTGLSSGWSATYLMGVIVLDVPRINISSALVWGLVAFMWWAISGLVNPDKVVVIAPHEPGCD